MSVYEAMIQRQWPCIRLSLGVMMGKASYTVINTLGSCIFNFDLTLATSLSEASISAYLGVHVHGGMDFVYHDDSTSNNQCKVFVLRTLSTLQVGRRAGACEAHGEYI